MKTICNEVRQPIARLLLAHGAGANKDSAFMEEIAQQLALCDVSVIRFDFPYMLKAAETGKKRPPDRVPALIEDFSQMIDSYEKDLPLFIGGKSMGGRIATLIPESGKVRGVICYGYPFHPPGKPEKHRTEHLYELTTPTLIVQGERDTFGTRERVDAYQLPSIITIEYLTAADHSFKPLKSSGLNQLQHIKHAARLTQEFIKGNL
ncbi:MAG: alpha/beta fold hydrolase [Aliiglaciecola sp.]|uniref:alpha/beta family hydrolase n=1 Tax=Aliiglaciecola sp. M165 TaxID=2593649 RepID=UPI00117C3ED5|nr:alpha/beta family hydrolase [Aliiglaciecola sp. M165]TRY29332.1 alpha/beta hydrolase [Aliiglaciecola sp. M165]